MINRYSRLVISFILFGAGLAHFFAPEQFIPSVPPSLGNAEFWVFITGVLEIAAIIGLFFPRLRLLTGYLLVLYFISILPAHFEMVISGASIFGFSDKNFFIFRIFLQPIPIFLAWFARKGKGESIFKGLQTFENNLQVRWNKENAWLSKWMLAAAFYNLAWGYWVVVYPTQSFILFGMNPPEYLFIWQSVGMIVGVFGIGYAIAALDEQKHYPIVLVGALGKLFGPIGFIQNYLQGNIPLNFGTHLLFNDLIWWPAFWTILFVIYKKNRA